MRDHSPLTLEQFNGLWARGEPDECPPDHFTDCDNIKFIGTRGFGTRDGLGIHQSVVGPLSNVLRAYNYITQSANTLLVLVRNGSNGEIYHVVDGATVLGPILTVAGMTDFAFAPYAGRAFLSPFSSFGSGVNKIQKGLENEFVYVYNGDGTAARKAAGDAITSGSLTIVNGTGFTDAGFHLFGVVGETDTGYLTPPARFTEFTTSATNGISFSNIPTLTGSQWVARRLVMTRAITDYNGNTTGYTYYFIPDGRIADNTTTVLNNITVFDADLLEDASHLLNNFSEIPAGVGLTFYHGKLCVYTTFDDISVVYVSQKNEPEAIDQVEGILIAPLDGNPITNLQEFRDVLYGFKKNRTFSWVDNDDEPSSWPFAWVDYGIGCPVHGIATVTDSGAGSIDYLITASFRGMMIFNGRYADPELSWKVADFWLAQDKTNYERIQILDDSVNKIIYCALPDHRLLIGDYGNGLDPKRIRWTPNSFDVEVTTLAFVNQSEIIIGAETRKT
jgi:hypothetical protein